MTTPPENEIAVLRSLVHLYDLRTADPEGFRRRYETQLREAIADVLQLPDNQSLHFPTGEIKAVKTYVPGLPDKPKGAICDFFPLPASNIPTDKDSVFVIVLGRRNPPDDIKAELLANIDCKQIFGQQQSDYSTKPIPVLMKTEPLVDLNYSTAKTESVTGDATRINTIYTVSEIHAALVFRIINGSLVTTIVDLNSEKGTFVAEHPFLDFSRIGQGQPLLTYDLKKGSLTDDVLQGGDQFRLGYSPPFQLVDLKGSYKEKIGSTRALMRQ